MRIVDLSVPVGPALPCTWPGETPFTARPQAGRSGLAGTVYTQTLQLDEHVGTHLDHPRHVVRAGCAPDPAPPDMHRLSGRARLLDARHVRGTERGRSPAIPLEVLDEAERRDGALAPGDVALVWTGWSDQYYRKGAEGDDYLLRPVEGRSPGWPVPEPDLLTALAERSVQLVGIDAPSIGAVQDPLVNHLAVFDSGMLPVENLTNLGALRQHAEATFLFLPLALTTATGLPGRAAALVDAGPTPINASCKEQHKYV